MGEVVVVINGAATVVDEADAPRVLGMPGARAATAEEAAAFLADRASGEPMGAPPSPTTDPEGVAATEPEAEPSGETDGEAH